MKVRNERSWDLHFFLGMEKERDRAQRLLWYTHISVVNQHMANPSLEHWIAVKRIFRYLQGTLQFKLRFGRLSPQDVVEYCDVDWAGDLEDRRSTTGFVFMMGGGATSWSSKRQPTIALSMTEAEYMASTQATKEDDKAHERIRVHEREEGDGDSM